MIIFEFQDYVCDLLGFIDLLSPLKAVMTALQSYSIAPWKCVSYNRKLIERLSLMNFNERSNTPNLSKHYADLEDMKFKGEKIIC